VETTETSDTAVGPPPAAVAPEPTPGDRARSWVRILGILVIVAGVILIAAGIFTWFVVQEQLSDEKITVSEDADRFGGDPVDGPLTAYAEADAIEMHALEASGGQTYAQLDRDDPVRETVMQASFLRASLFTSVVSFGVAAMAMGLGVLFVLVGVALILIARRLTVVAAAPPAPAPATA
jgi:uncharacterized membrane protein